MNLYTLRSAVVLSLLISNTAVFAMDDSDPDSSKPVTKQSQLLSATATARAASRTPIKALETLDNESRDPYSLVSVLPKDIVTLTQQYLNPCPVLTINSKILDKMGMMSCKNYRPYEKKKFLNSTDAFMREYLMKGTSRNSSSYIFQDNGVDYLYCFDAYGVSLEEGSLKDVLVEDNPAFVLRGVLHAPMSSDTGNKFSYSGVKGGKFFFSFDLYVRSDAAVDPFFDKYSKKAERLTD